MWWVYKQHKNLIVGLSLKFKTEARKTSNSVFMAYIYSNLYFSWYVFFVFQTAALVYTIECAKTVLAMIFIDVSEGILSFLACCELFSILHAINEAYLLSNLTFC